MYRFSYVQSVSGKATEVTREMFHEIIRSEKIRALCGQIAEQQALLEQAPDEAARKAIQHTISRLKRSLPAFCWHAWFDEGKRKNYTAHPGGLVMIDVDHVDDPRALFAQVAEPAKAQHLLAAHITPSTKGLRLVFPVPDGMDTEQAQNHYVKALSLPNVDSCTKDLARLSFCVPESYFLFLDEELFQKGENNSNENENENWAGALSAASREGGKDAQRLNENRASSESGDGLAQSLPSREGGKDAQRINENWAGTPAAKDSYDSCNSCSKTECKAPAGTPAAEDSCDSCNSCSKTECKAPAEAPAVKETNTNLTNLTNGSPVAYEAEYDGIPYKLVVESLQELLGGAPAHGSRNNFIFAMAAYLRYVCNDDPEWIATLLPTYGEAADRWRRTIDSACQRAQYKVMPQIVKRAIEQARQRATASLNENDNDNALPPEMPKKLPKLIAHLVKNVPEVCRPAVANAVFPALGAHLNGVKFHLIDGTEKEATFMCVTMAKQSSGKSAVNKPIEYIVADIVERDEINRRREQEWKDASANKGANKEKPRRPDDLCVQVLVSDMTNAAFVQRMKDAGGRYLYTNLEELELLRQLQTNGTRDVGKIICLCFDNGKYGQERVGTQSVTARVDIRWNWNASSTIQKGIQFFRGRLMDGTLSRLNVCTILPDKSKPFVYGRYDEAYADALRPFITNLNLASGLIECRQALDLARRMAEQCAEEGTLADDEIYEELSHRAVTIAYLKAMVLYIANDMTWSKEIADFAEWSLRYDLWCKQHFFGNSMREEEEKEKVQKTRGRQNLLELLPTSFTVQDAQSVRQLQGLSDTGCRQMIASWTFRGYIEHDPTLGLYVKTQKYLARGKS